jgi:hypothetical protein
MSQLEAAYFVFSIIAAVVIVASAMTAMVIACSAPQHPPLPAT